MKKSIIAGTGVVVVVILGFLLPPVIIPPAEIGTELRANYQRAVEPFGPFLLTARILSNQADKYEDRCVGTAASVHLQSYTWMLIPGPIIEACVLRNANNEITGLKNIGTVERKR